MFLTDLTFIHDGNPDRRGPKASLINIDKFIKLSRVTNDLLRFQVPFSFMEVSEIQEVIVNAMGTSKTKGNQEELYRMSLILEPRMNADNSSNRSRTGTSTSNTSY
jgi:hypothetical protein